MRALRLSRKLSVRKFARELGYATHSYISDIEAGRTTPRVEFVLKVANFFQVSMDTLTRDEIELEGDLPQS